MKFWNYWKIEKSLLISNKKNETIEERKALPVLNQESILVPILADQAMDILTGKSDSERLFKFQLTIYYGFTLK